MHIVCGVLAVIGLCVICLLISLIQRAQTLFLFSICESDGFVR
jgi:hypothetical protein